MSIAWLKNRFSDVKYFYWVAKNWRSLKDNKYLLKPFLIYLFLYPIPRLFLGRRIAHKILPKLTSCFKNIDGKSSERIFRIFWNQDISLREING